MNFKSLNIRQICLIFVAFCLVGKILIMPAITAKTAHESFWISALLNFALDGVVLFAVLKLGEKFEGKSFFNILEITVGKTASKILLGLYALFFFLKAYIPIIEQKNYIEISLYETVPTLIIFISFFMVSAFISYKGLRGLGRCADISIWFTAFGFLTILALSVPSADFSELLPVLGDKTDKIPSAAFESVMWHFDCSYMLFILGKFKTEKRYKTKILLSFVGYALATILFMMLLYAEFGIITERQFFAPIRMGKYSISLANVGRVDYVANIALSVSCVFNIAMPLVFSSMCLAEAVNFKRKITAAVIPSALMAVLLCFTDAYFNITYRIMQSYIIWFLIIMAYVVPIIALLFKNRSKNEVSEI